MTNEKRSREEVITILIQALVLARIHLSDPEYEIADAWKCIWEVAVDQRICYIK